MRVIISGANGFVGSSLVRRFVSEKIEVLAIDVSFSEKHIPSSQLIKTLESDFSDIERIKNALLPGEYDLFYNFAWRGVNGPDKGKYEVQLDNISTSLKCAELANALKCKKYLCAGTIAERAVESLPRLQKTSPGLMYAVAKHCDHLLIENYCKSIGLNFIWMQFSNIFGPNNKTGNLISYVLSQLRKREAAVFGPANQPYDFIFADDLIEAVFKLGICETHFDSYFIGSGSPRVLSDYLITVGELFGRPDLIKIGQREDDGIKYSPEMFDTSKLIQEIGDYVSDSFESRIRETIKAC